MEIVFLICIIGCLALLNLLLRADKKNNKERKEEIRNKKEPIDRNMNIRQNKSSYKANRSIATSSGFYENKETRDSLENIIKNDPEETIQTLRAWLRE